MIRFANPKAKTVAITTEVDEDGDIKIMADGIAIAFILEDGRLFSHFIPPKDADKLRALGFQIDDNRLVHMTGRDSEY